MAPQANEWSTTRKEVEVMQRRRPGAILLFLLAGLVVAVLALGLAAWSVLRDSGGDDTATSDTQLGDIDPEATPDEGDPPTPGVDDPTEAPLTEAAPFDPAALQVEITEQPFICDGGTRQFGEISNAEPNEEVAFSSPQARGLQSGMADGAGRLPIRWQCDQDQAGITWELTATGVVSGRSATFIFSGAALPIGQTPTVLTADIIENPFKCDGGSRIFGGLSGADPNEEVAFTSPQASGISNGQADADGTLNIRWSCDASQAGTTWDLTATGVTSGRTVTFSFTGS